MDMMKLKNGSEEVKPLVNVTMFSLDELIKTNPTAFYDLVMLCRDDTYKPWGPNGKALKDRSLASECEGDWLVCNSIRNIVLSAAEGEGMGMSLGSPLAEVPPAVGN